jgi:single-strand DNA-binding protein
MNKPEIWTDREGKPQVSCEMTADIVRFNPFGGSGNERGPQEAGAGNQNNASSTGYSNQSSQGSYGGGMDDFGSSQGGGSSYSQPHHADESIPF